VFTDFQQVCQSMSLKFDDEYWVMLEL